MTAAEKKIARRMRLLMLRRAYKACLKIFKGSPELARAMGTAICAEMRTITEDDIAHLTR